MRANVAWCSLTWKGTALAVLDYSGADTSQMPTTDPHPDPFELSTTALCGNVWMNLNDLTKSSLNCVQ
jgi:hypothetical protein